MKPLILIRRLVLAAVTSGLVTTVLLVADTPTKSPKFFHDDPLWRELASQDASGAKFYEPDLIYDAAENMFAKPGDKDFNRRAENLNTVDEVADGNWFTNRAGMRTLSPEEVSTA